ncbi:non-ribosomal peptide synthetase|uniref:Pyochelin synthetase n=1 Tax=Dendrosporobacter quercicolus TaxID=146817 RepID=A0A1G9RRP9_9FIRM|nr:non-ribosomal peptide synthetase [Dendrosporobacter quercicolus]NSL49367.1 non-ribosomal peptide synthetase [Dendrosporobacter quercicolus DSM 1736]SDM25998.1 pyochelin synthetase [Dendrosporobacter quercicolus]
MLQKAKVNPAELLTRLRSEGASVWAEQGKLHYRAPKGLLKNSDLQALKDYKNDLLHLLQSEAVPATVTSAPEERFDPFPLTDVQSAYLLGRQGLFSYGGVACHIYMELNYQELDPKRTEAVWNQLIQRHDMLRSTIHPEGYQQVRRSVSDFAITFSDASGWDEEKSAYKFKEIREEMGHRLYRTDQWPLFDIAVTKTRNYTVLHLSMDLLIADWFSIWKLLEEFEVLYQAPERRLPELTIHFRDYLLAERNMREGTAYLRDKAYWLQRIAALPSAPVLPLARQQEKTAAVRFRRRMLRLNKKSWDSLKQYAQQAGLTPTAVVLAAYAAVIERWSENREFCLNLTLLNRLPLHPQVNDIVGDFTSVSLLAIDWHSKNSFTEQAKRLQKQLLRDLEHRLFSGVEVLREVARRSGREAALMPLVFTSAIGLVEASAEKRLQGELGGFGVSQTPQVFIDCQAMDSPAGLQVNWDVREGVFPDGMADDMFAAFEKLLRALAGTRQVWETEENVALPDWQLAERQKINATKEIFPVRQLHRQVLAQAEKTPDLAAVIDSGEQVSYAQLVQRAAAVAEELKQRGCTVQDRVAIVMDKGVHQVTAVLGVLLAEAVYVPIDIKQPELRRAVMLEQANVRFALTCSAAWLSWPETVQTIEVDKLEARRTPVVSGEEHLDLPAYIIYTSGSTGTPKGVVISHRAAANTVADINRRFGVTQSDRVLGLALLSFDLSVYDIFGPLIAGGAVVYPDSDRRNDPSHWVELMSRYEVTVWNSVPALMQMLITYLHSEQTASLPQLRLALLSGDWIPLTLPDMVGQRLPGVQVVSLGGATEAAIWSIYHVYKGLEDGWCSIPYGRPLANQGFRVLDTAKRDCPVWVAGELYITGLGLAEGYLGDPEITTERFFLHPEDGQRLYRTGDLGRYTPGGEIEFLGRRDNQVKIKGHRIELGEIEAVLLKHPAVSAAGVTIDGSGNDKELLAVAEIRTQERQSDAEQSAFQALTAGINELADAVATGLDKAEVDWAAQCLEQAALHTMLYTLRRLGLFSSCDAAYTIEDILQADGILPPFHWLVRRWIAKLADAGLLLENPEQQFSCPNAADIKTVAGYWRQAEAAWNEKLGSAKFIAYIRRNADELLNLLSGRQDPASLLFPEGRTEYVQAIYIDHVMANYLNDCMSTLLKRIAAGKPGQPLRILEVGAGTGATTERILQALDGVEIDYLFTDAVSFFLPAAKSRFGQFPGVRFGIFDVDKDYRAQGLTPNSFDVVLAAGVLENARDIPASMNRVKELLCPGGWLVFTEPTEEHAWILISQAFMMTEPGDSLRAGYSSYLNRRDWLEVLKEYGDGPVLALPEAGHKLTALGVHLFAKRLKQDKIPVCAPELMEFLANRLPGYMLPSHLQIADELPLTGNGKLDRKELAKWRPAQIAGNLDTEPSEKSKDLLEAQLARLWSEALGVSALGRNQNFYDYGADSLIMAQVAGRLRDRFMADAAYGQIPYDVLLRQMLNFPTIAGLAEFIRSYRQKTELSNDKLLPEAQSTSSSNAVLTNFGGEETGLLRVVFHAVLGTMDTFRRLLEHLKAQNLGCVMGVAIADTERYCAHEPEKLIEAVADDYASRLLASGYKKMQLIGYSMGGLIAVEVARRLVENGVDLADLVLIDIPPMLFEIKDDLLIEALFVANLKISFEQAGFGAVGQSALARGFLQLLAKHDNHVPPGAVCTIGGDEELDQVGALFRRLSLLSKRERFTAYVNTMNTVHGEQMPVEMAEGLFQVYCQSFKAACFTPAPYLGNIRLLLTLEPFSFLPGPNEMTADFWREICLGDLDVAEIEGNHFTCIEEEPKVSNLAQMIAAPLNRD